VEGQGSAPGTSCLDEKQELRRQLAEMIVARSEDAAGIAKHTHVPLRALRKMRLLCVHTSLSQMGAGLETSLKTISSALPSVPEITSMGPEQQTHDLEAGESTDEDQARPRSRTRKLNRAPSTSSAMSRGYTCHNYTCHNYTCHNYTCHNYTCHSTPKLPQHGHLARTRNPYKGAG
jgi:hypothetical protein